MKMNRRTNEQILDEVAGDLIPGQTDLLPGLSDKFQKESRAIHNRKMRIFSLSLMVILLGLIVSVPEVTSAMRRMLGFLPQAGIVDPSTPIRVLQEPVAVERDGVTVTVDQLYALPDRTVIEYSVSGIPESAYPDALPGSDPQGASNECIEPLYLRLPDGKTLTYTGFNAISGTRNVPSYEQTFTVFPIPGDVDTVTLMMPCIDGTVVNAIAGNWEISLRLGASLETAQLAPVYDLPTAAPQKPETGETLAAADQRMDPEISLILDKAAVLPDGYQVYGRVNWPDDSPYSILSVDILTLTDSQGNRIPTTPISPDPSYAISGPDNHNYPLALKVEELITQPGPLTLTAENLYASMHVEDKTTHFTLDTGSTPSKNQKWVVNQKFEVGGHSFKVISVTRLADGYEISIESDPDVACVDIYIEGTQSVRGQCGAGLTIVQYDGEVPSGELNILIANVDFTLAGKWQTEWLPPEAKP